MQKLVDIILKNKQKLTGYIIIEEDGRKTLHPFNGVGKDMPEGNLNLQICNFLHERNNVGFRRLPSWFKSSKIEEKFMKEYQDVKLRGFNLNRIIKFNKEELDNTKNKINMYENKYKNFKRKERKIHGKDIIAEITELKSLLKYLEDYIQEKLNEKSKLVNDNLEIRKLINKRNEKMRRLEKRV